ncbi:hypothetical protein DXG01_010489 [Tephrocybe rancida]|nr:hypothetical protein DXG01_010489 [Tephrocybe rancida]
MAAADSTTSCSKRAVTLSHNLADPDNVGDVQLRFHQKRRDRLQADHQRVSEEDTALTTERTSTTAELDHEPAEALLSHQTRGQLKADPRSFGKKVDKHNQNLTHKSVSNRLTGAGGSNIPTPVSTRRFPPPHVEDEPEDEITAPNRE